MAGWIEVWGREPTETELVLLYKFSGAQWTESFREEVLLMMSKQGITDVEIRQSQDGDRSGITMTPVWLYDTNGMQIFYVYVPATRDSVGEINFPPAVTYASRMFRWESARQRYEEVSDPVPVPCFLIGPEGRGNTAEGD